MFHALAPLKQLHVTGLSSTVFVIKVSCCDRYKAEKKARNIGISELLYDIFAFYALSQHMELIT